MMTHNLDRPEFNFPRGDGRSLKNRLLVTASWQGDLKPYRPGDIWLGRDQNETPIGVSDDRHLMSCGTNRSGKGTGLIIPNLCLWPGSTVVLDPKGENASITARKRTKIRGHKVVAIDPYNEAGLPEDLLGFINPLDFVDVREDDSIDIAGMIADSLVMRTNSKDAHWDETARDLVTGLILHVCDTEPPETRNLGRVRQLLAKGDPEFRTVMELAAETEGASDE